MNFDIPIFQLLFSMVFVLFLPGYFISYVFFDQGKIDVIERITLSTALSIAVVPLAVFYQSLFGVKITLLMVVMTVIWIVIASCACIFARHMIKE